MKKLRKAIIFIILVIALIFVINQYVYAERKSEDVNDFISKVNFSKDFENWVKLSKDNETNIIQPKIYDELNTPFTPKNPLYKVNFVGASLNSRYSLKDVIPNNVAIRNQYDTSACWAFSGLSSLETNLALNNYKTGKNTYKVYDFSERHLNYSATRKLANNADNIYGVNRSPSAGGQWFLVENYLTNGQGAINEVEMPFENNSELISIDEVQNKKAVTQVYDTVYFDDYNKQEGAQRDYVINEIKQHIQNYGSVFATIHGDSSDSIMYNCYNNDTGAKYCNDAGTHGTDHAVSIIGWDDNYSVNNFAEGMRPSSNGAWIVRNSWGESFEYDLNEFKTTLFNTYPNECISNGWNSPSEIPNDFFTSSGYTVSGDKIYLHIGDGGYMYVSYEDCNVGSTMYGIENAVDDVEYDYLYQYDELYPGLQITFGGNRTYLCNIFDKKSNSTEYLTGLSLIAPETYTCKVYVNPNGSSKSGEDLKLVQLRAGESETIDVGYHTLEFAEPLEITGEQFAVAIEITGTRENIDVVMEGKIDGISEFDYAQTETGKCFISSRADLNDCTWFDLGTLHNSVASLTNGDSSVKAFTVTKVEDKSLDRIEIETPPTKVNYKEGENFDKSGMTIRAYFNNNNSIVLNDSDYSIENGNNLKLDQNYVTITYLDKSVNQPITVTSGDSETNNDNSDLNKVENSNMKNAYCVLNNIQAYYYTQDSSKDYTLIDTEISGISRNTNNDSYEYYYYLSQDGNLKSITDWVKIKESQDANDKLKFKIDSRDISNYSQISKVKDLYIYIKESVIKGGNQSVVVSNAIKFEIEDSKIDTYVDNVKKQNDDGQNSNQNNNDNNEKTEINGTQGTTSNNKGGETQDPVKDSTTSNTNLPATGKSFLVVAIIAIIAVGIVIFIRYEVLNKYVK